MQLLVTTFEAILVVHLNDLLNVTAIEKVETGAGIYFGASRDRDRTYVVSRNVDIDGNVPMPDRVTNSILECNIGASLFVWRGWSHRDLHDLHQIRVGGPYLCVLTSLTPCLRIFESRGAIADRRSRHRQIRARRPPSRGFHRKPRRHLPLQFTDIQPRPAACPRAQLGLWQFRPLVRNRHAEDRRGRVDPGGGSSRPRSRRP